MTIQIPAVKNGSYSVRWAFCRGGLAINLDTAVFVVVWPRIGRVGMFLNQFSCMTYATNIS